MKQEESYDTAQKYGPRASDDAPEVVVKETSYVVQKYISKPALYKEHKYDFRIYVLLTSVIEPMSIFVYNEGLVRLASEKYTKKQTGDNYVHLTNYSLNKANKNYNDSDHKLLLSEVLTGTMSQPPSKPGKQAAVRPAHAIWDDIESIVVKTIMCAQPQLQHIYRSC